MWVFIFFFKRLLKITHPSLYYNSKTQHRIFYVFMYNQMNEWINTCKAAEHGVFQGQVRWARAGQLAATVTDSPPPPHCYLMFHFTAIVPVSEIPRQPSPCNDLCTAALTSPTMNNREKLVKTFITSTLPWTNIRFSGHISASDL